MAVETEVKIQVTAEQLTAVREKLPGMGALRVQARAFEKNMLLDYPDKRLRASGRALRIRTHGEAALLTFKGRVEKDAEFKRRPEAQTRVADAETLRTILLELGLEPSFQYDKFREIFNLAVTGGLVEICLDETPVGHFVEIEGSPEAIRESAALFGWSADRFIRKSYVELYAEAGLGRAEERQ